MVFSGDPAMGRSDLLEVVSVLDVDTVLERAVGLGVERTRAGAVVFVIVDEEPAGQAGPRRSTGEVEGEPRLEPYVHSRGLGGDEAAALRQRLGDDGLQGGPGDRPEQDVVRLRDPATGGEVLRVPVVVDRRLFADILLLDPPGGRFADPDVESIAVLGRVTGVAVRNARSYALNERRRESVELAAAVDRSVRPPFDLAVPLSRIAEGALRIAGARTAVVVSTGPHGVDVSAAAGADDRLLTRVLDEVADRLQVSLDLDLDLVVRIEGHVVWGLPLRPDHARASVVLLVLDETRARRPVEDREILGYFVRRASLVLDNAVLQQERQDAVLSADRDRIARDLHDVVIQRLYATALGLRAGVRKDGDPGGHMEEAIREVGDSIRDIRAAVFELERGQVASLRSAVLGLAREYGTALGFAPVVRTRGPVDSAVPDALADQVTVVLREVLSNCARHAGAARCEIDLGAEAGWFSLVVTDDGRGVDAADQPGSGLRNLRSRAELLGGGLTVERVEPHGTRVSWRVPLEGQSGPGSPVVSGTDG